MNLGDKTKKTIEEEMKRKRRHGMTKSSKRSAMQRAQTLIRMTSNVVPKNHKPWGGKSGESDDSPKKKAKKIIYCFKV